jgi:hypothetical protein
MSITKCVKCDFPDCSSQLHFDPMMHPGEWHLPDAWLTMVRGDTQFHSAWHFCSKECLRQWLQSSDSLPLAGDWDSLDSTQQVEVKALEYFISHYMLERTDDFHKQHPELRIAWGFHMEPHIREDANS